MAELGTLGPSKSNFRKREMGLKYWVMGLWLELLEVELVGQCYPQPKLVG